MPIDMRPCESINMFLTYSGTELRLDSLGDVFKAGKTFDFFMWALLSVVLFWYRKLNEIQILIYNQQIVSYLDLMYIQSQSHN